MALKIAAWFRARAEKDEIKKGIDREAAGGGIRSCCCGVSGVDDPDCRVRFSFQQWKDTSRQLTIDLELVRT